MSKTRKKSKTKKNLKDEQQQDVTTADKQIFEFLLSFPQRQPIITVDAQNGGKVRHSGLIANGASVVTLVNGFDGID